MENSFWYFEGAKTYPTLDEDVVTDVAIIGGGLAGVMCAYELLCRGHKVCILEGGKIGQGETGRSSAMVSFAHDLIYNRLITKHGEKVAKQYLSLSKGGLEKIEKIISENKIDCDFHKCDMVLFARTKKGAQEIVQEKEAYSALGQKTELTHETELPFLIKEGLRIEGQGYLNPYKFLHGLCDAVARKGGKIFENTRVVDQPKDNTLKVGTHTVNAKVFVIAAHFPYLILPGFYFAKMYQDRSHNIVFSDERKLTNIYESAEDTGFEYRPVENGILCGGANIRTGKYKYKSQYKIVEENIAELFGASEEDILSRFSAQDCMTFDMLPFVGQYSNFLKNVLVVTGFNKWGFTNSAAASDIIADIIESKNTEYNIFDTKRAYLLNTPLKAIQNVGNLAVEFANLLVNADAKKIERLRPGLGAIVKVKGHRLGVYKDEQGKLRAVSAICPHMGCSLRWNKDECTWDCPCHGSRFDTNGNILNNPSIECAHKVKVNDEKDV